MSPMVLRASFPLRLPELTHSLRSIFFQNPKAWDRCRSACFAGQNNKMIDNLFTGNVLGHESDIADGRLRGYEFRSLNNIVGDYYVSPRFLEAVAVRH